MYGQNHHYSKNFLPEDLLGREAIILPQENITANVANATIMITGAAGSIGSELTSQLCSYAPAKLILIDQSESQLHDLVLHLSYCFPDVELHSYVADITDVLRMAAIFSKHQTGIIFHTAAYKHVPFMEKHPYEAIKTNIIGTATLADLALAYGIAKFVFISTDKALKPASVMGATKRFGELYLQHLAREYSGSTRFIVTRFGNVLGSNGSFLHQFAKQIHRGGPVTITHPDAERYIMTVSEACQLVLEAAAISPGNETLCFDMGDPVRIVEIAKQMIVRSGLRPDIDIKLKYIGLRPGEKLHEERSDACAGTAARHSKIRTNPFPENPGNYMKLPMAELLQAMDSGHHESMVAVLKMAIPEYISSNSHFEKLDAEPGPVAG
jgi:FlaA1/EpsC-like NDP-sugar epimerase